MPAEAGHVTLETYFLDGTKIEADANRFSFTWRKGALKYRDRLREKVGAHLAEIDRICEGEEAPAPADPAELDAEAVRVSVNLSFADFTNEPHPFAPTHMRRSRQRHAPLPASRSGARSLVR